MRRLVIDELTRARQLADTVHPSPIKMQFRILSAEGHVRIGMSMCEEKAERANQLKLISDYMAYRLCPAFVLASELDDPKGIISVGVDHEIVLAARVRRIGHERPLFGDMEWLSLEGIDSDIIGLLPRGWREFSHERLRELEEWFGPTGRCPAKDVDPVLGL
jgi:hypothetical protein